MLVLEQAQVKFWHHQVCSQTSISHDLSGFPLVGTELPLIYFNLYQGFEVVLYQRNLLTGQCQNFYH